MPTLERIEIEGFKSIRKLALDLRPINVLIGANGAGKSNFISAFMLMQEIAGSRLIEYVMQVGGAEFLLHHGQKQTPVLRLGFFLTVHPVKFAYALELSPSEDDLFLITDEHVTLSSEAPKNEFSLPLVGPPGTERGRDVVWSSAFAPLVTAYLEKTTPPASTEVKEHMGTFFEMMRTLFSWLHPFNFHDTRADARLKQLQGINDDEHALNPDASNLASLLYRIKQKRPEHYSRIVATVRLVAPYFDDFRLRPFPGNERMILLEWSERNSDNIFNAHALSDGTLRFICLTTLLLQPAPPKLIIIDEPELGLHPYAIQLLAGLVRSAAQESQIIISTQSVTLVNQFDPEDLIIVDRHERESTFRRPTSEEIASWLEDYSLGELWEKNLLGGRPG